MAGLKRIAPYFLVGPISGPLLAGVVFSLQARRPIMAGIYAIGLVEYVVLLPSVVAKLTLNLL
jgi:hypothetical protein